MNIVILRRHRSGDDDMSEKLDDQNIPVVDLGAFLSGTVDERLKLAQHVDEICRSIGFLIIKNHDVPKNICDAAWSSAKAFFEQNIAYKNTTGSDDAGCPRGYTPIEGEALGKTLGIDAPPDRKESFSIGPLKPPTGYHEDENFHFFYGPNIWPQTPAEFRENWIAYYKAMEILGAQIMQLLAAALGLEDSFFVKYHTHHISALRSQNYPSLSGDLLPGQLRAAAHSDYGTVTILNADPDVGGLEVKSPSGNWISAPKTQDAFIINIGDLMARWTNDRWVSTLHRVVDPVGASGQPIAKRQSMAYFMNPNYDASIDAIPTCVEAGTSSLYLPVQAGQYLMNKFMVSN